MMVTDIQKNPQTVAICWLYSNKFINRILRLGDDELEIKHVLTLKKYRNSGFFSKMLEHVVLDLSDKEYKRLYSVVEVSNHPLLKAFKKLGFFNIKNGLYVKQLGSAFHLYIAIPLNSNRFLYEATRKSAMRCWLWAGCMSVIITNAEKLFCLLFYFWINIFKFIIFIIFLYSKLQRFKEIIVTTIKIN